MSHPKYVAQSSTNNISVSDSHFCIIVDSPISSLGPVDVKIFRHEFITIFRFSEIKTLHPADICIIEEIDDSLTRYEEENDTVFLARDLMCRLRNLSDRRLPMQIKRYPTYTMGRRREG